MNLHELFEKFETEFWQATKKLKQVLASTFSSAN